MNISKQSSGGTARGIISRREAIERIEKYNSSPKICKLCSAAIKCFLGQKLSEVTIKDFCSHSCSAKFNNSRRIKRVFRQCGIRINLSQRVKLTHSDVVFSVRSKGELFKSRRNWQSARSSIQQNARRVWIINGRLFKCSVCGYDKHAEIAHIKAVSDFTDDTLMQEVNAIDNLRALCPNHHWEFDNLN